MDSLLQNNLLPLWNPPQKNNLKESQLHTKILVTTKKNLRTRILLDLSEYDPLRQLMKNPHTDHAELETTLSLMQISLKTGTKMTKHVILRVFTQISTMEIAPRPQDFSLHLISSCL